MQRWGISEARLPPGSTILFREPTAWEKYRWQMVLLAIVLLAQTALIAGLLNERRRRLVAEVESRQRMAELAHLNRQTTAGELSASIAHELNQFFFNVTGTTETFFMFTRVGAFTHPAFAPTIPLILFALFQLKFAIITPALITGSFAERVRFSSYLLFMCLFSIFIYSPLAHWTWHPDGFLHKLGVLDFAGGTVVHMSAGFAALAGAMVLGRRNAHRNGEAHTPANIPFVILGTGMLWFGWFGFNAGSALSASGQAAMAFATTNTASASAALAWIFFDRMRGQKPSALGACVGAVVGLVAITPAAGYVSIGESIFIGTCASVVSNLMVHWKNASTLDDTLDVFPCHGVGGMVGMLMTGFFAKDVGLTSGHAATFLVHCGALVFVAAFSFGGSYLLYKFTDLIIPLRVSGEQEEIGLDLSQHGELMQDPAAFGPPAETALPVFAKSA